MSVQRPTTSALFAQAIQQASADGHPLRITGSDSLPLTAFPANTTPTQLSTLRLNKLLHHAPADMAVSVQAGISLEALQKQLAWHNQWLPVDPPIIAREGRTPGQRTIGGLIASNSLGPLRAGCGDWRLFILGMTWIDAQGTLLKGGGQTVKNVAGYATPRMMIGSCGSLGAIAEVILRTFSRPADEKCILFFCNSADRAETLLAAINLAPVTPAWLQTIGGQTFATNPLQLPPPPGDSGIVIAAGFLGRPEVCQSQIETLRALPAANGIDSIAQTAAQAGRFRLWMASESPLAPDEPGLGFRLTHRPSESVRIIETLERRAQSAGVKAWIISEAANGALRGTLFSPHAAQWLTETGAQWFATQGNLPPMPPRAEAALFQRLKNQLDPEGRFGSPP